MNLESIPEMKDYIKVAPLKVTRMLYKLIFEVDGDRNNRKRLREFSGFNFQINSDEYNNKFKFINDNFLNIKISIISKEFSLLPFASVPKNIS